MKAKGNLIIEDKVHPKQRPMKIEYIKAFLRAEEPYLTDQRYTKEDMDIMVSALEKRLAG